MNFFSPCLFALLLLLPGLLSARAIPEPLAPWVDWVLAEHPDLRCPTVSGERTCLWPGSLELDLNEKGGRFSLQVLADKEGLLSLPGRSGAWPEDLRLDGRPALQIHDGAFPQVQVSSGSHRITGHFLWNRMPESLPVPASVGLVELRIGGKPVAFPRREESGLLWLQSALTEDQQEDRLSLEVFRRVDDGVPLGVITELRFRVSGRAREVRLSQVLLPEQVPVFLQSSLPARLDAEGDLHLQVRAGTWTLRIQSHSRNAVEALSLPSAEAPWPQQETWVFVADSDLRSTTPSGAPGVDPARTALPDDWRSHPAYRVERGGGLELLTTRRGKPEPPEDTLTVQRSFWLDESGDGFTVDDQVHGTLLQGGRLEASLPGELGQAHLGGMPQVVTAAVDGGKGGSGVEVRDSALSLRATLRYPRGAVPAVGWNRDAQQLGATLHLPPGWTLVAVPGADAAAGSWLERWSLLDLFFLLLIALAAWRLVGLGTGVLALAVLGLAWFEPEAPKLLWLVLLGLLALERLLDHPLVVKAFRLLRVATSALLLLWLVVFCWEQSRVALFPQLGQSQPLGIGGPYLASAMPPEEAPIWGQEESLESASPDAMEKPKARELAPGDRGASAGLWEDKTYGGKSMGLLGSVVRSEKRAARVDPNAVVQTGPGLPRWQWSSYTLSWTGTVLADQTFRPLLLSPGANRALGFLRIAGLLLLAWLLLGRKMLAPGKTGRSPSKRVAPLPASLLVGLLLLGSSASAQMNPEILHELEARLSKPPACAPQCIEVELLQLTGTDRGLRIEAKVHAAAPSGWVLPGPSDAWIPTRIKVDGRPSSALRRQDDGYLVLRLEKGVHAVVLEGPARDSVALRLGEPRLVRWSGQGWTVEGLRSDGEPITSLQLTRSRPLEGGDESQVLEPWLHLVRELDLGIPWLVHNELRRLGSGPSARVRVPLLEGESVTDPAIVVEADVALVSLDGDETVRRWDSTLEESELLELRAQSEQNWMETWVVDCSPMFHCTMEGLPPTARMDGAGRWKPQWQPWPGESLTLKVGHPMGVPGATATVHEVKIEWERGRRILEAHMGVELRSSQGTERSLTLPPGTSLQSFRMDGVDTPVLVEDGALSWRVEPGEHRVELELRWDKALQQMERLPRLDLGMPVSNITQSLDVPTNRWLLWAGGPSWGPVVLVWQYILALLLAASLLARFVVSPLRWWDWFLLGLGMTQVPLAAPIFVALWIGVLSWRGRNAPEAWWAKDLLLLTILGLTLVAMGMLYWGVHTGLVLQPNMQVEGGDSYRNHLVWFTDQASGPLPQPWVLWLPLWSWRMIMLLWALWMAVRLLGWLRWGWQQISVGGLVALPPRSQQGAAPKKTAPEPASSD